MQLQCLYADTCLSDYWGGHHLAHVCFPARNGMTIDEVRQALHSELDQGAIAGADKRAQDNHPEHEDWLAAAHAAVDRDVNLADPAKPHLFADLAPDDDAGDNPNDVQAYFVFRDAD